MSPLTNPSDQAAAARSWWPTVLLLLALLVLGALLGPRPARAQSVGIGTSTPDASAALHLRAPNKGLLLNQVNLASLTDAAAVPGAAYGLLVFNTNAALPDGAGFYFNAGTSTTLAWTRLSTGAGGGSLSLPYSGSVSYADFPAFRVTNTGLNGDGLAGNATASGGVGVSGSSLGSQGQGVVGLRLTTGQTTPLPLTAGVAGVAYSDAGVYGASTLGRGVQGTSASNYGVYGSSTSNAGVYGTSPSNVSTSPGVWGATIGTGRAATGVLGTSTDGYAVRGIADGSLGYGVQGVALGGRGVDAQATSGTAVFGTSQSGIGVYGVTSTNSVSTPALWGDNNNAGVSAVGVLGTSDNGYAVRGTTLGGTGLYGYASTGTGVYGQTEGGGTSFGIYGAASGGTGVRGAAGAGTGVSGSSTSGVGTRGASSSGIGVRGSSGSAEGVVGISTSEAGVRGTSTSGIGVTGESTGTAGVRGRGSIGVRGESTSSSGIGVWATASGPLGQGLFGEGTDGAVAVEGSSEAAGLAGRFVKVGMASSGPVVEIKQRSGVSGPALDVQNGAVRAPEVNSPNTGAANLLPLAYGRVTANGTVVAGTGNFTVVQNVTGLGTYTITITNPAGLNLTNAICQVTPRFGTLAKPNQTFGASANGLTGGRVDVQLSDLTAPNNLEEQGFSFVIYRP